MDNSREFSCLPLGNCIAKCWFESSARHIKQNRAAAFGKRPECSDSTPLGVDIKSMHGP